MSKSTTIAVPSELLRTLINAADEGAAARKRDADAANEQGDPQAAQDEEETQLRYEDATREALELERAPQCNADLVADLLDTGPMHQLIIMEAIRKYAEACAKTDPAKFDNPMISGRAWVKASADIVARLDAFYGRHDRKGA